MRHALGLVIALLSLSVTLPPGFPRPGKAALPDGDPQSAGGPLVIVSAAGDQVRFSVLAAARRVGLEVLSHAGDIVYESGLHSGSVLEWPVVDGRGSQLRDGTYGALVTVEEHGGRLSHRRGVFRVTGGAVDFSDSPQPGANAAAESEQEKLVVLREDDGAPLTMLTHDGAEGWLESGKGGLSFYAGTLARRRESRPQMRLTADGNLGVGTEEPAARLDVRGLIRTSGGIVFPDGSVQKTAAGVGPAGGVAENPAGKLLDLAGNSKFDVKTYRTLEIAGNNPAFLGPAGGDRVFGLEGANNTFYGLDAGNGSMTGAANSLFGRRAGMSITSGGRNSFFGSSAGDSTTSGAQNSFFGDEAGRFNTTGSFNSFFGISAGVANTTGGKNAFFGMQAGENSTTGTYNSVFGYQAGQSIGSAAHNAFFGSLVGGNSTADDNSFFGSEAGRFNTTGPWNSFFGRNAGRLNSDGAGNSYFGYEAGFTGTSNCCNAFFGMQAGFSNTTGSINSFVGQTAGYANTTGSRNSFFGYNAGASNTVEEQNTFLGYNSDGAAGITNATAIGARAQVTQSNSLVLGSINGVNSATADTNVGIGITAPERRLHISETRTSAVRGAAFDQYSADPFAAVFILRKSRNATAGSHSILQNGDALFNFTGQGSDGTKFVDVARIRMEIDGTPGVSDMPGRMTFWTTPDGTAATVERMRIDSNGNVGIGTTAPAEKLHVVGNIRYSGSLINAAPEEPVPDYVFEPDYKLMPVEELARFVEREKHLPNVPSAAQIKANGLNIGEFQMKLLEKIEELTLYTLRQANALSRKDAEIIRLNNRIDTLEQAVERLSSQRGGR